jgi:hypothetical protein
MTKTVSEKSTKTEILDAYNELVVKVREQKAMDSRVAKKETEEKETVKTASQNSVEGIVKNLANLKLDIVKAMDTLEEKLIAEFRRLTELQQAIHIETKELDDTYGIKSEAETLATILLAQKEKRTAFELEIEQKKSDFEADMGQKKAQWKKEQEEYESAKKERDQQAKKERQREEEEYEYDLQLKRKKDNDVYETKKAALEKQLAERKSVFERDFAEREALIASKEKELADLRTKVESFPKELDKVAKDTEKSVTDRIEFKYKYQAELGAREVEGEKRLHQQMITALEAKIKDQDEQIRQLTQKANESVQQVQAIAVKAIEGASAQRVYADRPKEG